MVFYHGNIKVIKTGLISALWRLRQGDHILTSLSYWLWERRRKEKRNGGREREKGERELEGGRDGGGKKRGRQNIETVSALLSSH